MKLQFLVPQYKEDESVIKFLLDSIAIQQNVDLNEVGVIICNDGSDVILSDEFLNKYPFKIEYYKEPHKGVSATRNFCLDKARATYVMICDADDGFLINTGLWLVFREMEEGFDALVSNFTEETRDPNGEIVYINHDTPDATFVHGKVYRRKYLLEQNLRFNPELTIHEDSFFNIQAQRYSNNVKWSPTSFYLWRWNPNSVCRSDIRYILKTYQNMLQSMECTIKAFLARNRKDDARQFATQMIYDMYMITNKKEWLDPENLEYRDNTEKCFYNFYRDFKFLYDSTPEEMKNQIFVSLKNRYFQEGMFREKQTFDQWLQHIVDTYGNGNLEDENDEK